MPSVTQPLKETQNVSDIKDVAASRRKALTFFKVMAIRRRGGAVRAGREIVRQLRLRQGRRVGVVEPQPHGFIYFVYVVATPTSASRWAGACRKMVLVMLAGFVPFLSVLGRAHGRA